MIMQMITNLVGRNNNYSHQHLWVGFVTKSRWLNGESFGMVIALYIKGSGSNSGRKVRLTVKEKLEVGFVYRVWQ